MADLYIGCSGFNYPHWRGRFYPGELPERAWFGHYCGCFRSVELNVTFYRLVKPETFSRWQRETPAGFSFSLKGSRFITHVKRLADPEEPLERFFAGASHLGEKLRTVLWQLPPAFGCNTARLARFLALLGRYPVRHALELRNATWDTAEVADLCREHRVALCLADWPEFTDRLPLTADFVYLRRHGRQGDYATCYSQEQLRGDADRIARYLGQGLSVQVYFNNDADAHAPTNALELARLLEGPARPAGK
ncbi:MAG TPA: DUF72 domain-containing protein, partial [Geobacteraceae bacterium]